MRKPFLRFRAVWIVCVERVYMRHECPGLGMRLRGPPALFRCTQEQMVDTAPEVKAMGQTLDTVPVVTVPATATTATILAATAPVTTMLATPAAIAPTAVSAQISVMAPSTITTTTMPELTMLTVRLGSVVLTRAIDLRKSERAVLEIDRDFENKIVMCKFEISMLMSWVFFAVFAALSPALL